MTEAADNRDYFISYTSADADYGAAINASLRDAGYTTYFAGTDLPFGANIAIWMDRTVARATQVLALCSPDYFKPEARYSEVERAAAFWDDADGAKARLVPVQIADCDFTPLYAPLRRIDIRGMTLDAAATALIAHLKGGEESRRREHLRAVNAHSAIFRVPHPRRADFTGHEQSLSELHMLLSRGQNSATICAVTGIGGKGKSTIAAEYAHRFGTKGRYGGVWWVDAESSLLKDLAELATKVGLEDRGNLSELAREGLEWVGAQTTPWLLIYDNVPDPDAVHRWMPAGSTRVIITSRFSDFSNLAQTITLDFWDEDSTTAYLLEQTERHDEEGARNLAETLGGLPLAVNQAAAYLRPRGGVSFSQYAENVDRLIQREKDVGTAGAYPATVYGTLVTSIETLGAGTRDLLCLLSWLSPDGIEEALLVLFAQESFPDSLRLPDPLGAALRDEFERADLIADARTLSLLRTSEYAPGNQRLFVHRVVQAVLRNWQHTDPKGDWGHCAARIVSALFTQKSIDDPNNWPWCFVLLPHVHSLAAHGPREGSGGAALFNLLGSAASFVKLRGDWETAAAFLHVGSEIAERITGKDSEAFLAVLYQLAEIYGNTDRLDEAKDACERVVAFLEENCEPYDLRMALGYNALGRVHFKLGEYEDAEDLALRAKEIVEKRNGVQSSEMAWRLNALSVLYRDWANRPGQGHRLSEARRLAEQSLAIARELLGERHPAVATFRFDLAVLLAQQEDYVGAAREASRSVAIAASLGMWQVPSTQEHVNDLLTFWRQSGEAEKAERLLDRDGTDLLREVAEVERLMKEWVAVDPGNRGFGPPPFDAHGGELW